MLIVVLLCMQSFVVVNGAIEITIKNKVDELKTQGSLHIEGADIIAKQLIIELYDSRNYQPLWGNSERSEELILHLKSAPEHGLRTDDYFVSQLESLYGESNRLADFDILATEALIRFGYHQRFGKVNPHNLDSNINFKRELLQDRTPIELITDLASSKKPLEELFDEIVPRGPLYRSVQESLVHYLKLQADGGWSPIDGGQTLHKDDQDPRVVQIRKRLYITGDLSSSANAESHIYDTSIENAVAKYQLRNNLEDDGVAGKQTIESMNVPIQYRIDQMRLTLERIRWVQEEVTENFLAVNIANFQIMLVKNSEIKWKSRVMVGKPYRQTPVFRGDIQYLEFNPTWTIPPGILRNDTLPAIKKDPNYLTERNISVIDSNGNKVDPSTVDWNAYSSGVPYTLRQEPGSNNALGRVKFIFPNKHFVFLHDTPSKTLFSKAERAFSSGCIRVEHPFQLAELLLDDSQQWNTEKIHKTLDSKETKRVNLNKPFPVLIVYLTAVAEPGEPPHFANDIYNRDENLLNALNGKVTIELPNQKESN